jgi:hypothetical protein
VGICRLDSSGLGYEPVACSFENGNESLGSIKDDAFLEWRSDYYLLKRGFSTDLIS